MGAIGNTNDPQETKSWLGAINYGSTDPRTFIRRHHNPLDEITKIWNEARRREWWVLCLTQPHHRLQDSPQIVDPFGAGYAASRMWAHYAEDHRGVCLEFDGPALMHAVHTAAGKGVKVYGEQVTYKDGNDLHCIEAGPNATPFFFHYDSLKTKPLELGVREHIERFYREHFFEKTTEWEGEKEFRFLMNRKKGPVFADVRSALTSVILGANFPKRWVPLVRRYCGWLNVGVARMRWDNRLPTRTSISSAQSG